LGAFDALKTADLTWSRDSLLRHRWMLTGGSATLATLEGKGPFSHRFRAITADASWTFDTRGFLGRRVVVRAAVGTEDLGELKYDWRRAGTFQIAGGAAYPWRSASFWGRVWKFQDVGGTELTFKRNWATMRIDVDAPLLARRSPDIAMLTCLGAYLLVLAARRRAAGAGAAG
jgi:hypothetical protein